MQIVNKYLGYILDVFCCDGVAKIQSVLQSYTVTFGYHAIDGPESFQDLISARSWRRRSGQELILRVIVET